MKRPSLLLASLLLAGSPLAADFSLDPSADTDTVRFESTAALEFVSGKTNRITGSFSVDPDATADVQGLLRVDLGSIKTGIDLRDRHMRENHLHTERYPYAFFELTDVRNLPDRLTPGETVTASASGSFFIHGGYRPIDVDLKVTRLSDTETTGERDAIRIHATFRMKLEDFGIERPKALFLKVAETIELDIVFTGYSGLKPPVISLPDWPRLD